MFRTFDEIEKHILLKGIKKRITLCGAHDEPALSAFAAARRKGVVDGILIGDEPEIRKLLTTMNENPADYTIINEPDDTKAAQTAIMFVKKREADIPMKGLMQTSSYMRAILNKETGLLAAGKTLSQCTIFEYPDQNRLIIISDCAVNITPSVNEKTAIIKNAAALAAVFGIQKVKVAVISALEKVNPKIQSTVEADELAKQDWPENIIVEGPFALDNAISQEAAIHKGIVGVVAGQADVFLMPDLCSANILHKSLHFFAHYKLAGAVCGAESPVILTSRTDSPEAKYFSILTAILQTG